MHALMQIDLARGDVGGHGWQGRALEKVGTVRLLNYKRAAQDALSEEHDPQKAERWTLTGPCLVSSDCRCRAACCAPMGWQDGLANKVLQPMRTWVVINRSWSA